MPELTECSSCGSKLTVPDNLLGQEVKCPRCGTIKVVGAASHSPRAAESQSGERKQEDYRKAEGTGRRSGGAGQHATAEVNGPALGLGIASLVLGIIAIPVAIIPCIGIWSLPVSGVGLVLGVSGLIIVLVSKRGSAGFPIAGSAVSFVAIAVAGLWMLVCAGMFGTAKTSFDEVKKNADEIFKKMAELQRQDAGDWVDASKDAARNGDVEVRVTSVTIGPVDLEMENGAVGKSATDSVIIRLVVKNVSLEGKAINYKGWIPKAKLDRSAAALRDNGVFAYPHSILDRPVKGQIRSPIEINAGESREDVFAFHAPRTDPKDLRLELPATAFGGIGSIKFRIPPAMIKR